MEKLRRPEIIEKEIIELEKQLEKSREYYQYEFICNSDWSDDMIGFFNLGNGRKILQLLNDGKELQYRHAAFGKVNVKMNPQKNRIIVSENTNIYEDNILTFIFRANGEWWLKTI
jgi:hypothetical protein